MLTLCGLAPVRARGQEARGLFQEVYTLPPGIVGRVEELLNDPSFPDNPSSTSLLAEFEAPTDVGDLYGQRVRGFVLPSLSGDYTFWVASDDYSVLYLSTDEAPANKAEIASVPGWTNSRQWTKYPLQKSEPVPLVGGQRYYVEALMVEAYGGDNLAVRWRLPDLTMEEPIGMPHLVPFSDTEAAPAIRTQPTNVETQEGREVTFWVEVENLSPMSYQWQRDGREIPGAFGSVHTLPVVALADSGARFRCLASNSLGTLASDEAILTVLRDTVPPTLVSAENTSATNVVVVFSEPVEAANALLAENYTLAPDASVGSVAWGSDSRTVVLTTTTLSSGTTYTLTVNNVRDRASPPNQIAPDSQIRFTATVAQLRGLLRELYEGIAGATIADLRAHPGFPDNPTYWEYLTNGFAAPENVGEYYGQRLRGYLLPPLTGNYTFWVRSDDASELYLSTDTDPAKKRRIAWLNSWSSPGEWTREPNQQSSAIRLESNRVYYVEALMAEGWGEDSLEARWELPGGAMEEPIPAARLLPWGAVFAPPVISVQPTNVTALEGGTATFSVVLSSVGPATFQWQENGVDIPGANAAACTHGPVLLAEDGARFRCVVANAQGRVTSAEAVLTVLPDTTPPTIVEVHNVGSDSVLVAFSEAISPASAANTANYNIAPGVRVNEATLDSAGTTVLLKTTAMAFGSTYTLTVNGIQDRAAVPNTIARNTQVAFTVVEFTPSDLGGPAQPGSMVVTAGGYVLTGGGLDIGGASDQGLFAYQQRSGDFDVRVRVASLTHSDVFAEAGLMAREALTAESRFAGVFATPSLYGCFMQWRLSPGQTSAKAGAFPVNYPYTWLRLQRRGNTFNGYASFDGELWTQLSSASVAAPATVFVGMAVSSHSAEQTTRAQFMDFGEVLGGTIGPAEPGGEPLGPSSRRTGLVISEIMYHPAARADGRQLEFVELFNTQPFFEDISGWRLTGALDFTFAAGTVLPAGGFLVVARVPDDVRAVYGIDNVVGGYTNVLQNNAGTIRLRNQAGAVLLEAAYADAPPWPAAAAGAGHSLVLARPSHGEGDPQAWAASAFKGGSPGMVDPVPLRRWRQVVINELLAHTDDPQRDFVELYNHSNEPVDISGCWLSDSRDTNKFQIPAPTILPAGGYCYFTQDELGFALNAGGETIYFSSPDQGCVVDAVRFGPQALGLSTGRYPDGAPTFSELRQPTPGLPNETVLIRDIVINEIMFHPISGDSDDEYVELYNQGARAVDLSGWRFVDGIEFEFPARTLLGPDACLVVARNAARLRTNHANLTAANTVGNYAGSLANGGERLALGMPEWLVQTNALGVVSTNLVYIVADEVRYHDQGRWSRWADGGGSSLELIDPHSDNRLAANWADSDETAKSAWATVEHTGVLDNGLGSIDELHVMLLGAGECLLDNLEVSAWGGPNLVLNSGFESGLDGWIVQGNHVHSGLEAGEGLQSWQSLRLRATAGGDNGANRVEIDLLDTLFEGSTATIRAQARWLRGHPDLLLRVHGNDLEAVATLPVPRNPGTPGALNSRAVANAGPAIYDVAHHPVVPAANRPVVVAARLDDPDGIAEAQVRYRLDPSPDYTVVPMNDEGRDGDAVAGDGVYSGTIPGAASGALLAFVIQATDQHPTAPATTVFPPSAPQSECLVRFGETRPAGVFGTYRLWLTEANRVAWEQREQHSNEPLDTTFVYGEARAVYGAGARYRGSPFIRGGYNGPLGSLCGYVLTLPKDDMVLGADEFNLDSLEQPGRDPTLLREKMSFWIARQMGIPFSFQRCVNLLVNGVKRGQVYSDSQQPNGDYVASWFPNDSNGELFKIDDWFEFNDEVHMEFNVDATLGNFTTTGGEKKQARYRWCWEKKANGGLNDDYTSLFALVDAVNAPTPTYTQAVQALVDVDEWMREFALRHIVGDWDGYGYRRGKNTFAYKPPGGRWQMLLWDLDFSLGGGSDGTSTSLFDVNDSVIDRMYAHPPFRRAYLQAFNEAANGPLLVENAGPMINAIYAAFSANGVAVQNPSSVESWINSRRDYILQQLASAMANFAITTNGGKDFTVSEDTVTLGGTAPLPVRAITVNGVPLPLAWTSVKNWSLRAPLHAGRNRLVLQGIDCNGNPLDGSSALITVTSTASGVRPPPVFINEWMADNTRTVADPVDNRFQDWFELYNAGAAVVNLSGFSLSDQRDSLRLWIIPPGTQIAPGGFLMIWADGEPEQNGLGPDLHAAFQLDKDGDSIILCDPDKRIVDEVAFGRQSSDVSEGRWPDGCNGPVRFVNHPTPRARNRIDDNAPLQAALRATPEGLVLTWNSNPGSTYSVERAEDISAPAWVDWREITATDYNTSTAAETAVVGQGFYRVRQAR